MEVCGLRGKHVLSWALALLAAQSLQVLCGQTRVDLKTQSKMADFSASEKTKPFKVGTVPPSICDIGEGFFRSDAVPGQNLYLCTAANVWSLLNGSPGGDPGMADPGVDGLVARIGTNTSAARTLTGTSGKIVVSSGDGVSGNPAISIGADVVDKTQSNSYAAGAKQTFQASEITAGQNVACAALPSTPETGDIACDSGDGNKLKHYSGSAWMPLDGPGDAGTGFEVLAKTDWTADNHLVVTDGLTGRAVKQIPISYDGSDLVIPGGLLVGTAVNTGLQWTVGNQGDMGASSVVVRGGDAVSNAEPGYFAAYSSDPTTPFGSFLYPCTSAGNWCSSGTTPGADSTNVLLSAANTATVQNKSFDGSNSISSYIDWTTIAAPSANPGSGSLRVYAKTGAGICWKNSSGTETCAGAGGGDASVVTNSGSGAAILKTGTNVEGRTLVGQNGVTATENANEVVLAADPLYVLTQAGNNSPTGNNDFSGAASLKIVTGTGAPSTGCASAGDVGKMYARSDAQAAKSTYYGCGQTGSGTYGWELIGDGGGGGGGGSPLAGDWIAVAGSTVDFRPNPKTMVAITDEFLGGGTASGDVGQLRWRSTNGGTVSVSGEAGHPGIIQRGTGSTIGTVATTYLGAGGMAPVAGLDTAVFKAQFIFRVNQTTETTTRIGFASSSNGDPPTSGIYLQNVSTTGAANWFCVTRASTSETADDSTIPVDTNWHSATIEGTGNSINFYIDGTLRCTHSADLYAGVMFPWFEIKNTEAAAKGVDIDAFSLWMTVNR